MNLIEFFNNPILELPKSWDNKNDSFDIYLSKLFDSYLLLLENVTANDYLTKSLKEEIPTAKSICDSIIEIIRIQFNGHPAEAYGKLKSVFAKIGSHKESLFSLYDVASNLNSMYRIRIGPSAKMERRDLFHIPFEKRHLVASQRYSIQGLPCLYLGGSIYICCEELGRPDLHTIHISRFELTAETKLKLLEFGKRPSKIGLVLKCYQDESQHDNIISRFIIAHSICWPIIAACSIKLRYENAPFKPEYIIPQLILQWVTENDEYDGIHYFSTYTTDYFDDSPAVSNFVFPARTVTPEGYCVRLCKKFELTDPLYWQLAQGSNLLSTSFPNTNLKLRLSEGAETDYCNTEFGMMESYLAVLPCRTI